MEEVSDNVAQFVAAGWKHCRIQLGGYNLPILAKTADFKAAGFGEQYDGIQGNWQYNKGSYKLFELIRKVHGEDLALIHDMHERFEPIEAVNMVRELK